MSASASRQAHIGFRVLLVVVWTVLFLIGLAIGLLLTVPGFAEAVQQATTAGLASMTVAAVLAVALILSGLYGIVGSYRNLRHAVDLIAEVDRARKETIQLESTRYMQQPK